MAIPNQAQVDDNRTNQTGFTLPSAPVFFDKPAVNKVGTRAYQQEAYPDRFSPGVKYKGRENKDTVFIFYRRNNVVEEKRSGEKYV
jgi:hypothetical protein